ncbi:MAG: Nif11 family protein [Alphaproteobacteria bacterium]|nr:Nif11 family protein [Alphaproteobacteria bacterium]
MSKPSMNDFIKALRSDASLSDDFAKAVSALAKKSGFDVTEEDVRNFVDEQPVRRPLPGHGGATTMALGEEGKPPRFDNDDMPSVTLAIGEEDGRKKDPKPQPPKDDDWRRRVTTLAMGEEGKRPQPPKGPGK